MKKDLWKIVYFQLKKRKSSYIERIVQVDGGFFEKWGSLFREHAEYVAEKENLEKKIVAEAAAEISPEKLNEEIDSEQPLPTVESDEDSVVSTDSEGETEKDQSELIAAAWNIDELYREILYEILHNVGCDVNCEIGQTSLFFYAQDAFKISNDKHRLLMEEAEKKEAPSLLINVEVIEAKDLRPKDSNGFSDPFVTLYLASNTTHRYNTSVKPMTLNPIWEEHFALPISENASEDTLCLEVWDFDPAESVKEKLGKVFDVKGLKGMRKLVKEIAVTATSGQHENELIGKAQVPLSAIPASGMTMWYSLDKKNKLARQGVLKVRLSFSSEKNNQVAEQEYRHLLRIILLHELETSKVAPHWWCGSFTPQGNQLLTQHIAQSRITPTEAYVCQYCVFAGVHHNHALSFALFANLLDKLVKPIQTGGVSEEDVKLFWDATKKLLPSSFAVIRKIRKKNVNEKTKMKQVTEVLKILRHVISLEPPPSLDLFPVVSYPWISYRGDEPNNDIASTLNDAVTQGANDWLNHILDNNKLPDVSDVTKMQNMIQIINLIRSDLQKSIEFYDKLFQETVNFQYAKAIYVFYQAKLSSICEPEVREICKSMKQLNYPGYNTQSTINDAVDPLLEGTSLFELYLAIQRFATLGVGLCPADCDSFHIKNFHNWFHDGVARWLDVAVFKALQRIEKAVELDQLVHVDHNVQYSSSAVDTLTIFYQVKVFWEQLNWPDVESCYSFIAKIIDDICRCSVFYADKMAARVEGLGDTTDVYEKKFEVTNEWCLAINNIDYVRETLEPFTRDLGMTEVIRKIGEIKSPVDAQRCERTLDNVIANAVDTVKNKIIELLEIVVKKMAPSMKRLLIEGAELCEQDCNSIDRLMMYVDNNLSTLNRELNEENFNRTLELVWDMLAETLDEIIQTNIDKRRPPSFFANLHKTLNLMLGSFKNPDDCTNCDALKRTEDVLRVYGLETSDLIHEVHKNLHKKFQSAAADSPLGQLTVIAKFSDTTLSVKVLNGRNLLAMDSNGSCDSFVRIHLLPEHKFVGIDKPKTKTHNRNQFPLYDEEFTFDLSCDQRQIHDGLILFSVKDKDLLGYNNQYIGEAFLSFSDLKDTTEYISGLPQVQLQLNRPTEQILSSLEIRALEHRQGDKQAKDFLKKIRQRMGS
ncbi:protein unc-13 homolog 4B isoform X2 [Diorhabda sublineata]|uniref:protein unc-13 homolog 4B isoform X2 n=1 Tax=Diorhabda sublineata TaxID=1163346 RepID=UPI0024E17EBF|nr:protein unc-13 homolog 4B isoform X2 [Diorhabda sublineata]